LKLNLGSPVPRIRREVDQISFPSTLQSHRSAFACAGISLLQSLKFARLLGGGTIGGRVLHPMGS